MKRQSARRIGRIAAGAWLSAALGAAGCAPRAGDGANGAASTPQGSASASGADSSSGTGSGAGSGRAAGANSPAKAPGAMTAEEMAAQADRDIADFKRVMAARQGSGGGGSSTNASAPPTGPASSTPPSAGPSATEPNSASTAGVAGGAGTAGANGTAGSTPATAGAAPGVGVEPTPPRRVAETPEALAGAAAALYRDASRADTPMRSLMALAALSIADPDRPFNAEALTDITEEERRTLTAFHGFCRELGRQLASSDDPETVAKAVDQLSREMRGERRLRLSRGEFCTSVEGFGRFAAIETREFVAHAGARFVLYFEIDGYRSTEVGSDGWKTELSIELSILSERDGVPVWRRDWQTITDLAASQRKDFFVTHVVAVPDALSVGAYVMKIRVRDELTGTLAEHSIPFRMVAAPVAATNASSGSQGVPAVGTGAGNGAGARPGDGGRSR